MSYDDLGRIKKESRSLKKYPILESYSTDFTFERSFITNYFYDFLDKITQIQYPEKDEGEGGVTVCYAYNALGQPKEIKAELSHTSTRLGTSTRTSCTDKTIVEHIDYNEFGQMTSVLMGNQIKMVYSYDIKGRVKELLYKKSNVDQVKAVYTYNIQNSIMNVTYTPLTSRYNPASQDHSMSGSDSEEGLMQHVTNVSYRYDGLNRLVYAKGEAALYDGYNTNNIQQKRFHREYSYSLHGNLTRKRFYNADTERLETTWNYSYTNHRVSRVQSNGVNHLQMGYDALGNMTSKVNVSEDRHQTLIYDFYNRLLVVREGVGENKKNVGRYWYDEQGFRVRKKSKQTVYGTENGERVSAIRWYELDYHNQYFAIERQKDEAGRVIPDTEYSINNIYLNGVRIAAMEESGAARYFLTDQVDSVKVVADDSGNAVSRIEYMPYGETWFDGGGHLE